MPGIVWAAFGRAVLVRVQIVAYRRCTFLDVRDVGDLIVAVFIRIVRRQDIIDAMHRVSLARNIFVVLHVASRVADNSARLAIEDVDVRPLVERVSGLWRRYNAPEVGLVTPSLCQFDACPEWVMLG